MSLRLANFGIRGFVGASLTPRVVMDFAAAFATFLDGRRVLLGRDTRSSSPMLHAASLASLLGAGCEVLDFGICPTPLLQHAAPRRGAAGAVSISGGHNGMGWNALTLIGADGAYLEPHGGEAVLEAYHAGAFRRSGWDGIGRVVPVADHAAAYFADLGGHLDLEAIRRAGFTVLIDPVGGAGCPFLEAFAAHLGFTLVPLNAQPSGYLAREAEPRPRSALQMASIIRHLRGDIGFVLSSDMGRLSVVTDEGEPASEEFTFALIANHVLGRQAGPVVTNCCTTRTIDDLAAAHGVPVIKTRVGQAYVVSALQDEAGRIGGEGSGSVAWPAFSPAFDGFLMMGLILEAMAVNRCRISDLLKALSRYHIVKKRLPCGSRKGYQALELLMERRGMQAGEQVDLTDGLRLDRPDGWVHARTSQTEQLVRVTSEAVDREVAERKADEIMEILEQVL